MSTPLPQLTQGDTWSMSQTERLLEVRITWGVPQTELDPLRVDFKAGCVVFKHSGDVALQETFRRGEVREEACQVLNFEETEQR